MRRTLLKLFRRRRLEADLEAELAFHREMSAAHGNPIPLGNTALITEQGRDLWCFNRIENLWRDLTYAARGLRRSPGLLASALLSLGLGIGANTTIFSLAVEFLLSEPSITDAKSLVYVRMGGNSHAKLAAVEFLRQSGVFTDVAGENAESFINWNDGEETRRLFAVQATRNYFTALGIPVAHGRGWSTGDTDQVAVLRHQFWRKHYRNDLSILGKAIELDGRPYTVIGILPESHRTLIGYGFSPDIYVPQFLDDTLLAIYARLKPGMSAGQARAAVQTVGLRLDKELPEQWKYATDVRVTPVAGFARLQTDKEAMTVGLFFVILLIAVGLVLLVACVNVAGLLLARSSVRRQEIAIRLSLGASAGRLFQQLLAESLLLSLSGAAFGFLFALSAARTLASIALPIPLPISLAIEPDWRVATYAAVLAIFSAVATGLMPAWQSTRESLAASLHRERRLRLRRVLVAGQIALSFVVLATGALFLRNLALSSAMSPGFDVRRTLRAEVHLPPASYRDTKRINEFVNEALLELAAIPGIEEVAAARIIPFTDSTRMGTMLTFADDGEKRRAAFHWNAVTPDFFRAMDIPLLAGGAFSIHDTPGTHAVIVNAAFVRQLLGTRNPVGTTFSWGESKTPQQIVGVVGDTKNLTIGEDDRPQLYQKLSEIQNDRTRLQFVLRCKTPPALQLNPVRFALRRVEPAAGLEVATLYSSIGLAFLPSQIGAALMGGVGLLGLLLVAIGIYGVLAFSVTRRTHEIGIRVAIGATRLEICRMVGVETAKLVGVGSLIGLSAGVLVTRPLVMFLIPGLSPTDPLSFTSVVVVVIFVGFAAALGPVRKALGVDPLTALRYE